MTWQFLLFVATLIALTVWAIWIADRMHATLRATEARERFYRSYADQCMAAERNEHSRRMEAAHALLEARQVHRELAGQYMELRALADCAIGQGTYPPEPRAWRELREATLTGEPSPMFGNIKPLRPFGAG